MAEDHVNNQLSIQRRNLLGLCGMCVKSLVDKGAFEVIRDECEHLHNFSLTFENILQHRLSKENKKSTFSFFGSDETITSWSIIKMFGPPSTVSCIEDMESLTVDRRKVRVWIRLALVQKRIASLMSKCIENESNLRLYYLPGSFMCSEEAQVLAGTVKCLNAIDFNICVRDVESSTTDYYYELNYSPYLTFRQSFLSMSDDKVERVKLKNSNSGATILKDDDSLSGNEKEEDQLKLKDLLKTEKEQRNYFEELVSVRDKQLKQLEKQNRALVTDVETQRKDLERIILELQNELQKKQDELAQLKKRTAI